MNIRKKLNEIRDLVSKNDIEKAISEMRHFLLDNTELNDSILLSSQLSGIKQRIQLNLISFDEYSRIESRITIALLDMLNKYEATQLNSLKSQSSQKEILIEIHELLTMTYQAFTAQARVRNKLHDIVLKRLNIKTHLEFEDFFNQYYAQMTDNEQLLHQTIRGYTENILSEYNFEILDLLKQNPDLKKTVPRFSELERHLIFWKTKYQNVFKNTPSMSLLYVGVDEKMGFPVGIEAEIQAAIKALDN